MTRGDGSTVAREAAAGLAAQQRAEAAQVQDGARCPVWRACGGVDMRCAREPHDSANPWRDRRRREAGHIVEEDRHVFVPTTRQDPQSKPLT